MPIEKTVKRTLKVRMTQISAGPEGSRDVGDIVDVTAEEGKALVEANAAVWVTATVKVTDAAQAATKTGKVERAVTQPEERAIADVQSGAKTSERGTTLGPTGGA